ncbi:MAG TPA: LppP/LprE family lipoprotein [Mycobacterium sp.]|jgi:hypothetical protein|nr:LppP/LprE family lipoprotein [Mycobacterium sp.]
MRLRASLATLTAIGLFVAGCGWSPPSAPPTQADTCTAADGPTPDTVKQATDALWELTPDSPWIEKARGHATNCRLYWVQVSTGGASASTPGQVLFFDRNTSLGPATSEPRRYVNVVTSSEDTVTVQYQWLQGSEASCCPTGIGTVRFQIADGKIMALDPIPNS